MLHPTLCLARSQLLPRWVCVRPRGQNPLLLRNFLDLTHPAEPRAVAAVALGVRCVGIRVHVVSPWIANKTSEAGGRLLSKEGRLLPTAGDTLSLETNSSGGVSALPDVSLGLGVGRRRGCSLTREQARGALQGSARHPETLLFL